MAGVCVYVACMANSQMAQKRTHERIYTQQVADKIWMHKKNAMQFKTKKRLKIGFNANFVFILL